MGIPGDTVVKNLPGNAGDTRDMDLIPGLQRSLGGGNGNPLWYFCLGNPMERGAWLGSSLWGRRELDMTEYSLHTHKHYTGLVSLLLLVMSFWLPMLPAFPTR